jgi:hypothetical protein
MSAFVSRIAKILWQIITQPEIDEKCVRKFSRKPQGKRSSVKPGRRYEFSMKMNLREIWRGGVE